MRGKRYPEEFKIQAVKQVTDQGRTVTSVAERLGVNYTSLSAGEMSARIVSQHSLVCTPIRWHFREHCETAGDYRDFVLSRVPSTPDINDKATFTISSDQAWNQCQFIEIMLPVTIDSYYSS